MKQLLSILSLLIIAFNLNAQIDVIKYEVEEIANISNCGRLSRGGDRLVLYKGYYALCLYTSNQFDDPIIVRMGDLEEALMTFKDIQGQLMAILQIKLVPVSVHYTSKAYKPVIWCSTIFL